MSNDELFGGKVEVRIYGKSPCALEEKHLFQIAHDLELRHIYHPQTHAFNGKICEAKDLTRVIEADGVKIHSGCLADGVSIDLGHAICLRTADCPTIVARHNATGETIAAHAGRASLIDEECLRDEKTKRQPESVVQTIHEYLDFGRHTSVEIDVYSCCGIGPMRFRHPTNHPQHGSFNQKMNRHIGLHYGQDCFLDGKIDCGALNLHQLIRNQFQLCGVPGDNIHHDSIDTARQTDYFFSRRGGDKTGHNTILVVRRG
ncbi:MAG: laccase domain-containing protein [Candidatus Vogelbacteria bacterium]|nr:laccase domain-containing protein [Candidatus Vogelbacteria bacterium]